MELMVQRYLRSGKPLNSLRAEPYCLDIKEQGDLALLKYNQYNSDFTNPIVRECRGIIFYKPTWDVVCFPFTKFFNEGEVYADHLDESELHVYEKVDGSLAKVWYFEGAWRLSSNGTIDAADALTDLSGYNFQSLFMRALSTYGLDWQSFTSTLDKNYTYMYELATEVNRIVVEYQGFHVYYLGQRNIHTFQEEYIPDERIDNVQVYSFKTIKDIIAAAEALPDNAEGYVVRDKNWNRVKIKSPRYFLLHKLANNGKPDLVEYYLENELSELFAYFPEYREEAVEVGIRFKTLDARAKYNAQIMSEYWSIPRAQFAKFVFARVPVYYQSFVFKTYENHDLTWEEYTSNWDNNKWRALYERALPDL